MKYYKRIDKDGNTLTVESYSHNLSVDGAIEIEEKEFQSYIDSLPEPPASSPAPDLFQEIALLKSELTSLKDKVTAIEKLR